jgi:hypothetical protein
LFIDSSRQAGFCGFSICQLEIIAQILRDLFCVAEAESWLQESRRSILHPYKAEIPEWRFAWIAEIF